MSTITAAPATDAQRAYLASLLESRESGGRKIEDLEPLTRATASAAIDWLKDQPRKAVAASFAAAVAAAAAPPAPAGYFAVEYAGALRFYRLAEGRGKWAGYMFVNRYISDDETRVSRAESDAVRAIVAADPEAAGRRFADEFTRCWVCGRMLTDEESRAAGIGPVCAGR